MSFADVLHPNGRITRRQSDVIRDVMLQDRSWATLKQIGQLTGYAEASISAQLRNLRKSQFGAYSVKKQRRADRVWEYRVAGPESI